MFGFLRRRAALRAPLLALDWDGRTLACACTPGALATLAGQPLAALLAPTYGVYAWFEIYEHKVLAPGKEEYLDSEKFQLRSRDWDAAEQGPNLIGFITLLNDARRQHPALQQLKNLTFHATEDDAVIAFSKTDGDDTVIVVCSMDPYNARTTTVWLDLPALGADWGQTVTVRDHVTGSTWSWGEAVYVRLGGPGGDMAHIAAVQRDS